MIKFTALALAIIVLMVVPATAQVRWWGYAVDTKPLTPAQIAEVADGICDAAKILLNSVPTLKPTEEDWLKNEEARISRIADEDLRQGQLLSLWKTREFATRSIRVMAANMLYFCSQRKSPPNTDLRFWVHVVQYLAWYEFDDYVAILRGRLETQLGLDGRGEV